MPDPNLPPMTLNVERLYELLIRQQARLTSGDAWDVHYELPLLVESLLAAIDHPYPTPRDAG